MTAAASTGGSSPGPRREAISSRARELMALGLVLALATLLRFARIEADPPLRFGNEFVTDEGFYAKNAKAFVRDGRLAEPGDEHNHVVGAPGRVALNVLAFLALGPSLAAARAASGACGLALVALAWAWVRREAGVAAGLLAALLVAVDPALVHLSRIALAEGPLLLAGACAFCVLVPDPLDARRAAAAAALWGVAFLVKHTALAFAPGLALVVVLEAARSRRPAPAALSLAAALAVMAAIVLAWKLGLAPHVPGSSAFYAATSSWHGALASPREAARLAMSALGSLAARRFVPGISASGIAGAVGLAAATLSLLPGAAARLPGARLCAACAAWIAGQGAFHGAFRYEPPRYVLGLALPAALAAAAVLAGPLARVLPGAPGRAVAALAFAVAGWITGRDLQGPLADAARGRLVALGLGLALGASAWLALTGMRRAVRPAVAVAAALLSFALSASNVWRAGSEDAAERTRAAGELEPRDVVLGLSSDRLTLDLECHSIVLYPPLNAAGDPFARFGVTALVLTASEEDWVRGHWPNVVPCLAHADTFHYAGGGKGDVRLYRLARGCAPGFRPQDAR